MTMTINHPESGQYQGHNRLIVAAIGVALAVSLAFVVQATTSEPASESNRNAATNQAFDVDQARSAETARLIAVNETPWAPTTPGTDQRAAETARLIAVNETPWAPTTPGTDDRAAETARLVAVNETPWAPIVVQPDSTSDQAFFLAINDVGDPSPAGATTADGHLAFFLSINDLDG